MNFVSFIRFVAAVLITNSHFDGLYPAGFSWMSTGGALGNALVLSRVEGRKGDCIYATNGAPISYYVFANSIRTFDEVVQYQVIQNTARDYVLKLNLGGEAFPRERELEEMLKSYLGADATLKIEYVDEIPVLASGKRRCLVNHFFEKNEKQR